jgi:large subunit ribosomal protein L10
MALTKAKKNEKVKMLATELEHSTSAIVGSFKGLTASKDFELRKIIREAGGNYHVVKNKLAAKSSEGTKVEAVKDNAEFTFKLGIVDGKVIDVAQIDALAKLPGKEELFSKLLFLIQSPAQRLATVINATGRNLAVVVNMAAEQGKFGAPPAEAKAEAPAPVAEAAPAAEAPATETPVEEVAAAHVEESAAGEQPSGAAEPENGTASQAGEAAATDPVEG